MEKAEILERTVLFLQNTDTGGRTRAEGGGQKHSFQDGFSTCLQRAAHFLGPEGRGLRLGSALEASFPARFSPSDSDSGARKRTEAPSSSSSSLLLRKSSRAILLSLMHRSGTRVCTPTLTVASCVQTGGESRRSPTTPQQPQKAASRASKQSHPVSQSLWRPWP